MANHNDGQDQDYGRLMKEALLELESLQSELEAERRVRREPIAVVGMGCRFPGGANSPDAYWDLLRDGIDAIIEVPPERWNLDSFYDPDPDAPGKVYSRHAGLVDQREVEQFSPEFFGISPREAERMDAQQRKLLEVCWEALEDAAAAPERVRGSRTGLFVGSCTDDYLQLFNNLSDPSRIDGYSSLGTARCITVGRVAYLLGLEGPAVQLDTACSSSLVAVHQACLSLRNRDCDMALAGGVNLQLSPAWTVGLCKLKALSPDGRCKTFDARADGFVRGEGCGIVVLRRLSDALADGDRILGLVRGTATNHDGRSSGLTVPNPVAQEKLLRQALQAAQLRPDEVDYVEAHGTGTSLGDPIEISALGSVFQERQQPLWVGSAKTNIGHLEAAAGIAGLIKILLALDHEQLPPHLHLQEPNPHIPWNELPIRVPTDRHAWPRGRRRRIAGVSSFGFSGTNAHVLVQEAPLQEESAESPWPLHLLPLSAESEEALRELARRYAARLETDEKLRLNDVCYTAAVGRSHFAHRLAILAETISQARQKLESFARDESCDGIWTGKANADSDVVPPKDSHSLQAEETDREPEFVSLAESYVTGHRIDWRSVLERTAGRKVSLPTYPFQRQRYWLEPSCTSPTQTLTDVSPSVHPLLGQRIHSAGAARLVQFERQVSAREPAYLVDHRVSKTVVLPATAQLEMALAAAQQVVADGRVAIENVLFHRALVLPEGETRVVQTVLTPEPSGHRFELFSREPTSDGQQQPPEWIRHASGSVLLANQDRETPTISIEELIQQCPDEVPSHDVYTRLAGQGLEYGGSFQLLRQIWRGPHQALGEVALPDDSDAEAERYWLHPALLDACLHVIAGMLETDAQALIVPTRLERFEVFNAPQRRVWSHIRLRQADDAQLSTALTLDVNLIDPAGELIARLRGLRMQRVDASTLLLRPHGNAIDWLYQVAWRPVSLEANAAPSDTRRTWLLLADHDGVGELLAQRLTQHGQRCVIVLPSDNYQAAGAREDEAARLHIRPGVPGDFNRLLEDVLADVHTEGESASAIGGVVHMWSLDVPCDEGDAFAASFRLSCGSTVELVQALANRQVQTRLWLVTRGAQVLGEAFANTSCLAQAPQWGLGKVIFREHPQLPCVQVDLDPAAAAEVQANRLFDELIRPDAEDQIVYRDANRFVARLERCTEPKSKGVFFGEGSYLITGGMGALGLQVADWLVDRGARHVVLTSRHGDDTPEQQEAVQALRGRGAEVQVLPADVSRREEVSRLVTTIQSTFPRLRGVVHTAGVLDDGALRSLDWPRFERVMGPKAAGAWHLHCLTEDLDFFVMFSSAAGLLGSPGQANYTAANAFLDALAQYRRALGQPALSIAWGPWQIGMTSLKSQADRSRIARLGLRPISAPQGLQALEELMAQPLAQAAAMQIDWDRLASALPISPLWAEFAVSSGVTPQRTRGWVRQLRNVPSGNRTRKLAGLIRNEVAAVLGWDTPQRVGLRDKLFDLGMDSLTSVELQRCLERNVGRSLPQTLAFDYPTVEALARYVAKQLNLEAEKAPGDQVESDEHRAEADRLAAMSDEEVQSLLIRKYKHLF